MGFCLVVYSTGDFVKWIASDPSTVKWAVGATYRYTSAAVTKINQVVRVDGSRQYWPDDESRAQIGLFTTTLAKNTARYVIYEDFKHIPGVTVVIKLLSNTMREVNYKGGANTMQAKEDRLEKDSRKLTSKPKRFSQNSKLVIDTMSEVKQENHKGGTNAMQAKEDKLEKESRKLTSKPKKLCSKL